MDCSIQQCHDTDEVVCCSVGVLPPTCTLYIVLIQKLIKYHYCDIFLSVVTSVISVLLNKVWCETDRLWC